MASQTHLVPSIAASQATTKRELNTSFDPQATLLLAAIESFTVGLIIVAQDSTILHKNKRAKKLLRKISCSSLKVLPDKLWEVCQSLMETRSEQSDLFPEGYAVVLENEIVVDRSAIHMRVQWFDWDNSASQTKDCFLITLEDREQSLVATAHQEAQRYKLTNRETDVWCLKRMGNSYKEIAATLFISENTVKKHLKNIYAKKEQFTFDPKDTIVQL